jgi:hypothetical protein
MIVLELTFAKRLVSKQDNTVCKRKSWRVKYMFDLLAYKFLFYIPFCLACFGICFTVAPQKSKYLFLDGATSNIDIPKAETMRGKIDTVAYILLWSMIFKIAKIISETPPQNFILKGIVSFLVTVVTVFPLVFSVVIVFDFIKIIIGKQAERFLVFSNEMYILFVAIFASLHIFNAEDETIAIFLNIEKSVNYVPVSDLFIVLLYFSFFFLCILFTLLCLYVDIKVFVAWLSSGSSSKIIEYVPESAEKNSMPKEIDSLFIAKCRLLRDGLWKKVEVQRKGIFKKVAKVFCIGLYLCFCLITLFAEVVYFVYWRTIIILPLKYIKHACLSLKCFCLKIERSNVNKVLAIICPTSLFVALVMVFIILKYKNIISDNGMVVYEFLLSVTIIPSILGVITAKRKHNNVLSDE